MLAIHARYRGISVRRADLVRRSAAALSSLPGVDGFEILGVEDICSVIATADNVCDVVMALLADGDWAVGIGVTPGRTYTATGATTGAAAEATAEDKAATMRVATAACKPALRPGHVEAKLEARGRAAESTDIMAVFALLGFILNKRTIEGREATALVRSGLNQNEAAKQLGISKQAMSQRLHAAGWHAEMAGWQLAVNVLERANQPI